MRLDDGPADRQPHAETRRLGGDEGLEDALEIASLTPTPVSRTEIVTVPGADSDVSTVSRRSPPSASPIASSAFSARFRTTCWSWMASPRTGGRPSRSRRSVETPACAKSASGNGATSPMSPLTSHGFCSGSRSGSIARRRLITSDARWPSSMMSPSVSSRSVRFDSAGPTSRRAASALLTMAPSGWLISCASVAARHPMAVTRWAWASCPRCTAVSASALPPRPLDHQSGDQQRLEQDQGRCPDDRPPVPLPRRRLPEADHAARRQPTLLEPPAPELAPIEHVGIRVSG